MLKCSKCNYTTLRNFNLKRHHFNKHIKKEQKNKNDENNIHFDENNSHFKNNKNFILFF